MSLQRVTAFDSSDPDGLLAKSPGLIPLAYARLPDQYYGFPQFCTDAKDAVQGKHSRACSVSHTYSTTDELSEYLVGVTLIPTAAAISCLDGNRLSY